MSHAVLSPSASGQAIHSRLYREYGYAKEHLCIQCDNEALDWAYLYTAGDDEVRINGRQPWSPNMEDYAPMCRSCHSRFDLENDPQMAERMREVHKNVPQSLRKKAGDAFAEKRRTDPEFRAKCEEQQREIASLGGKAVWENPEFAKRKREQLAEYARRRYTCDECGYVSNAPTVQRHLNRTGHVGRREINA